MKMLDEVLINGINVNNYRIKWKVIVTWGKYIDEATLTLVYTIKDVVPLETGMEVIISRGFNSPTDNKIFIGQISKVKENESTFTLNCKSRMVDTIKSAQTKSWDMNIDEENGIGSEIFKDICDNSSISYTPMKGDLSNGSVVCTGTESCKKIVKFIQNDEDDFQKLNELAKAYNYIITYNYDEDVVNFKPKGFTNYPVDLIVGAEITKPIIWQENMEQLINKVKIQGATVYDKIPESFTGPATEFKLLKTPEDTEVYINTNTTKDIQKRGQKGVGMFGIDYDYYVDVEQKKIVFSNAVSDVSINYGSQVPLPIILKNVTSIQKYGGVNKKPHFKKFTYTDIKDKADAERRGRVILAKYSTPFVSAENVPISDQTLSTYGYINPGTLVKIVDPVKGKNLNLFVNSVVKSYPHSNDKISIGDVIWRTEDWQAIQMEKINQLFNELNKNQDILIQTIDFYKTLTYERRYMYMDIRNITGNSFILGHTRFGLLGTSTLGSTGTSSWQTIKLLQGNNTYKEYLYDNVFVDNTTTTGTWDTTNKKIILLNEAPNWIVDSGIITGLPDYYSKSSGTTFSKDGDFYFIATAESSYFNGYKWNTITKQWDSYTDIVAGISTVVDGHSPTVFTKNNSLYLIAGISSGAYIGYKWNSSTNQWDSDNAIIAGLDIISTRSAPDVFIKNNILYLISGQYDGTFVGYKWNSSTNQWDSDNDIVAGLTDIGSRSHPTIFTKDDSLYLIAGRHNASILGYKWNIISKLWETNADIIAGLTAASMYSTPHVFELDNNLYLIEGADHGEFHGHKLKLKEIAQTLALTKGTVYKYFTITLPNVIGTLLYEMSGDGGVTWQTATLNTRTIFTSSNKDGVKFRITNIGITEGKIENTYQIDGDYAKPAITIKLEE